MTTGEKRRSKVKRKWSYARVVYMEMRSTAAALSAVQKVSVFWRNGFRGTAGTRARAALVYSRRTRRFRLLSTRRPFVLFIITRTRARTHIVVVTTPTRSTHIPRPRYNEVTSLNLFFVRVLGNRLHTHPDVGFRGIIPLPGLSRTKI